MLILVTGASGHLGSRICPLLDAAGHDVMRFDLPLDVCSPNTLRNFRSAEAVIHLAGMKFADRGEVAPISAVDVNVHGTWNVCELFGNRVILASTCKAADPETVYGCSKLIAERITLEAGGRVIRLVNVLGSAGSVTDIWGRVPSEEPLPVCDATRLFMDSDSAADLFVRSLKWGTGRYAPEHTQARHMDEIARMLHPCRPTVRVPLRRGDRQVERLLAACEVASPHESGVVRITGVHDPSDAYLREVYAA